MDARLFDTLARAVTEARSRRGALAAVVGSALGVAGLAETDAKKKKPCPPCKKRKKGKCKKKLPDGTGCRGGTCQGGRCVASPGCGAGGPCLVFLSSSRHTGNLGGLSGGDAICQGLATTAGLPGTYKAWLSDSTGAVSSRFVPSPGPYRLVNGTAIATSFTDLTDGTLLAPINVTETGGDPGGNSFAWTGTRADGNAMSEAGSNCANWGPGGMNGWAGYINIDSQWTDFGRTTCSMNSFHLYCFQQS
jgi:hypothetical protein